MGARDDIIAGSDLERNAEKRRGISTGGTEGTSEIHSEGLRGRRIETVRERLMPVR